MQYPFLLQYLSTEMNNRKMKRESVLSMDSYLYEHVFLVRDKIVTWFPYISGQTYGHEDCRRKYKWKHNCRTYIILI